MHWNKREIRNYTLSLTDLKLEFLPGYPNYNITFVFTLLHFYRSTLKLRWKTVFTFSKICVRFSNPLSSASERLGIRSLLYKDVAYGVKSRLTRWTSYHVTSKGRKEKRSDKTKPLGEGCSPSLLHGRTPFGEDEISSCSSSTVISHFSTLLIGSVASVLLISMCAGIESWQRNIILLDYCDFFVII